MNDINKKLWNEIEEPRLLLIYLLGIDRAVRVQDIYNFPHRRSTKRKLRLFACACHNSISSIIPADLTREAVELSEQYADGDATANDMKNIHGKVLDEFHTNDKDWRDFRSKEARQELLYRSALALALQVTKPLAEHAAYYASSNAYIAYADINNTSETIHCVEYHNLRSHEKFRQVRLIHCIFDDVLLSESFEVGDMTKRFAKHIYDDKAFHKMPELADMMEHDGCQSINALNHCRNQDIHSRGCWVLDHILGMH